MKNKTDLKKVIDTAKNGVSKKAPKILVGLGVVGFAATVVTAIKATPKAMQLIEEAEQQKYLDLELDEVDNSEGTIGVKLTPLEAVKVAWKPYIPTMILGVASAGCVLSGNHIQIKRTAALAAVAQMSREALYEYRDKVIEVVGDKKEKAIRDKVAEEKINKRPVENQQIIVTGTGDTLCYDPFTDRYFESNVDKIQAAINRVNYNLLNDTYVSLNEFYEAIGLKTNKLGGLMGWNIDKTGQIDVYFSAQLTKDNRPCLVIDIPQLPDYNYDKLVY